MDEILFRHSSNSRELSRQKFHNELACVFTAHEARKNADWNQQQLTDSGILANRNSENHPYCFLSNQKKSRFWRFCMLSVKEMYYALLPEADYRDKGRGYDRRLAIYGSSLVWGNYSPLKPYFAFPEQKFSSSCPKIVYETYRWMEGFQLLVQQRS